MIVRPGALRSRRSASSIDPPSGLSYASDPVTYTEGVAISANNPTVTGSVDEYTVSPSLPAGLSIHPTTGVISGTPTTEAAQASFVVTATNAGGFTTCSVEITIQFLPSSLSGLTGWWKASTGVYSDAGVTPITDGGAVYQVNDQSGNANHLVQVTADARPVYEDDDADYAGTVPTIKPASGDWMVTTGNITLGDYTVFMVVKNTNGTATFFNHQADASNRTFLYADVNPSLYKVRAGQTFAKDVGSPDNANWGNEAPLTAPATLAVSLLNGASPAWVLRLNGSDVTLSDNTAGTPASTGVVGLLNIGSNASGVSNVIGSYPEVIVYNTALSGANIARVEDYLRDQYAHY